MDPLKTINEVCRMLDLTARTIRFYEQCGLIRTVRDSKTAPRRLDSENIDRLKRIRFLRKLGLSLDEISGVIDNEDDARELIFKKSAEMKLEVTSLIKRITLLEKVLLIAENGGNIYSAQTEGEVPENSDELLRIGAEVTKLVLDGRFDEVRKYLNTDMGSLPEEFYAAAWESHLKPCGKFLSVGKQTIDGFSVYNRLHYEKLDVVVKTDILGGIVCGLLLQYAKEKE